MKIKSIFAVALVFTLSTTVALAGPIVTFETNLSMTAGGNSQYDLVINADGETYDAVEVIVENGVLNQAGGNTIFALPSEDTGFIGAATVIQGGSVASAEDSVSSFSGVAGFQAPDLISDRVGPNDILFQAVLPAGGMADYTINFLRAGTFISNFQATGKLQEIPEPTAVALAGLSLIGFVGMRRRS